MNKLFLQYFTLHSECIEITKELVINTLEKMNSISIVRDEG